MSLIQINAIISLIVKLDQKTGVLYLSAGTVAFSAIAFELVLATYATFLIGSTIIQYTLVFSVMMFAMGLGSLLSSKFENLAHHVFLLTEFLLSLLSLISIPLLYWIFSIQMGTQATLIILVLLFGILIGLEVPLLNTIRRDSGSLSNILFFDYLGGFLGGILFPTVLLPLLGFFRTSATLALINLLVMLLFLWTFRSSIKRFYTPILVTTIASLGIALLYLSNGELLRKTLEFKLFGIHS